MTTLYIAASHQTESSPFAHCLGDVVTSIKVAWLWIETEKPDNVIISLCHDEQWNVLWSRFIRENKATVIYDRKVGHKSEMYFVFDERRRTRQIAGMAFDIYKELYCRMEGGERQPQLCGSETGLGRKNIFEYFYYGQESYVNNPEKTAEFGTDVIDFANVQKERRVLIAPQAKCQGNDVFTFGFWRNVTERVLDAGIEVTLNDSVNRIGVSRLNPQMSSPSDIANYVARHALVACGNTGIGWVAGATGTPLFGMEPPQFSLMDFRYHECGVKSLKRLFDTPNLQLVADAIISFMNSNGESYSMDVAASLPKPVTAPHKLQNLTRWLTQAPPGPVVEVGVFEGGSLIYLASRFPDRQFFGFDTFEGCPDPSDVDNHHKAGDFKSDFESVQRACSHLKNVTLVKGRYPESGNCTPTGIVLAHVDCDMYESTKGTLEKLFPLMAPVSRIYCDDCFVDTCYGATIAMQEVAATFKKPIKIDNGLHGGICFGE